MSYGNASVFFGSNTTNPGSGGLSGANNGLTAKAGIAQLGEDVGAIGDPASFLNRRVIPMAGFGLDWKQGFFTYSGMTTPVHETLTDNDTYEWLRVDYVRTPPNAKYQEIFASTDNGGGVNFDLQHYWGFNIDKVLNPGLPSWSRRQEYFFNHTNYEDHVQFETENGDIARLQSFTFIDTLGTMATSSCLLFFQNTNVEFRDLVFNSPYHTLTGTPTAFVSTWTNVNGSLGVSLSGDTTSAKQINFNPLGSPPTSNTDLVFQTWNNVNYLCQALTAQNPVANSAGFLIAANNLNDNLFVEMEGSTAPEPRLGQIVHTNNLNRLKWKNGGNFLIGDNVTYAEDATKGTLQMLGITYFADKINFKDLGADPVTLNDGDMWRNGANLKARLGGVTKTFTLV